VPLTASTGGSDELLGGGRPVRPIAVDPVATRVLTKGEPINAPTGRSDDFSWPRGNVATVEPVSAPAPVASAPAAAPAAPSAPATTPAPPRAKQATRSSAQRENVEAPSAETPPPVRRRPRPPAVDIAPRDNAPRPPGLIGGR
jgi:hypothetical protein